jgi:hypothetical protein
MWCSLCFIVNREVKPCLWRLIKTSGCADHLARLRASSQPNTQNIGLFMSVIGMILFDV